MKKRVRCIGTMILAWENKSTRRKACPITTCSPQIMDVLTWDRARISAVNDWRLFSITTCRKGRYSHFKTL